MRRRLVACCVTAALAAAFAAATRADPQVQLQIGLARLVSPSFGYTVAYRTVQLGHIARTTIGVFVYDHGLWRNVTPSGLRADAIDDVAFVDPRHGWIAAYDCANVTVSLYRTNDGGHSWQSLGAPADHSCGGGPTWLSFVDPKHGWMEPVSPNGPAGVLLRTSDGGVDWTEVARLDDRKLPCLAPIVFTSRSAGWMGRCGAHIYSTADGGRRWRPVAIHVSAQSKIRQLDIPRFFGRRGVETATLGDAVVPNRSSMRERAVAFFVSADSGRNWSQRSLRPLAPCNQYGGVFSPSSWPAAVADAEVWWVVSAGRQPRVQVTGDAGRSWRTIVPRGLPNRPCGVRSVSAANERVAWTVVRLSASASGLFETTDGGRDWRRVKLVPADQPRR